MKELKKNVMEVVKCINNDWVAAIRQGEKEGGIDLTDMMGQFSDRMVELDDHFSTASTRLKKSRW